LVLKQIVKTLPRKGNSSRVGNTVIFIFYFYLKYSLDKTILYDIYIKLLFILFTFFAAAKVGESLPTRDRLSCSVGQVWLRLTHLRPSRGTSVGPRKGDRRKMPREPEKCRKRVVGISIFLSGLLLEKESSEGCKIQK
jgi:hypothetical protein